MSGIRNFCEGERDYSSVAEEEENEADDIALIFYICIRKLNYVSFEVVFLRRLYFGDIIILGDPLLAMTLKGATVKGRWLRV